MAKYIRTKDGCIQGVTNSLQDVVKDDIIKKSDNVEDLFDFFILKDENNKIKWIFYTYNDALEYRANEYASWAIYGAIDTDWGLKYVAKETGEGWELI